ncbi:MAG: tetratricopeptide repeat protein [Proteobacteria bacterium]|nr:tetratricopeptide repeat protein [Pseudomonadota bacterium]
MGAKKRVQKKSFIKKEVEEIVPFGKKVLNYFSNNLKQCLAFLSILLFFVLSLYLWNLYSSSQEKKALVMFTEAFKYYSLSVEKGNPGDYQISAKKFNDLASKYPRTTIAGKSLFYLGNCYFWMKDFNNAEKYYRLFLDKSSKKDLVLRKFAYEGLGYASEQGGKYEQALDYFKKVSEEDDSNNPDDSALINLARVYEELNQNDKAVQMYQKILKDYPQSQNVEIAKDKISILKIRQ